MTRLTDPSRRRLRSGLPVAALALVAYVPILLTSPGKVGGDTKSYLTIDPSRWLSRVAYVWQDSIGAGGVTHQNIGYLWPMGPWFWVFDKLGVPDVGRPAPVARHRAVRRRCRRAVAHAPLRRSRGSRWPLRSSTCSRPYLLHYSERMSVLLLPWAGLPWMVGLTARARQERTWRAPALFALLTATIGGINATSIILVGLGPILWLLYTTFLPRSAGTAAEALRERVRRAVGVALRIGVLSALTNAWWIGGLRTQGAYGLPVLGYTETYKTVADSSAAQEMLRGFGHWYFYGSDRTRGLGPAIGHLHHQPVGARPQLRRARPRPGRAGTGALPPPDLLPHHHRRRTAGRGRRPPVGRPVGPRGDLQGLHPHRGGPGAALHTACAAADGARPRRRLRRGCRRGGLPRHPMVGRGPRPSRHLGRRPCRGGGTLPPADGATRWWHPPWS